MEGQNTQAELKRESQARIKEALLENERKHFAKGDECFEGVRASMPPSRPTQQPASRPAQAAPQHPAGEPQTHDGAELGACLPKH